MSEHSNGSVVLGICAAFAGGALVGAALALLYAPRAGKETREMLYQKTRDLKDAAADAIGRGKHVVEEVKHRAAEVIDKGKEAVGEIGAAATRSA